MSPPLSLPTDEVEQSPALPARWATRCLRVHTGNALGRSSSLSRNSAIAPRKRLGPLLGPAEGVVQVAAGHEARFCHDRVLAAAQAANVGDQVLPWSQVDRRFAGMTDAPGGAGGNHVPGLEVTMVDRYSTKATGSNSKSRVLSFCIVSPST